MYIKTQEHKKNIGLAVSKAIQQKGYSQKYNAIHHYIRVRKTKPESCEICGIIDGKRLYLAYLHHPQPYSHNLADYQYVCYRCHSKMDNMGRKISEKLTGRKTGRAWNRNLKMPEEYGRRISKALTGKKRKPLTEEHKEKIRKGLHARYHFLK